MPNPFSEAATTGDEIIHITNSVLTCETCFEEVSEGAYNPKQQRLTFVCSDGHENIVKGIEL